MSGWIFREANFVLFMASNTKFLPYYIYKKIFFPYRIPIPDFVFFVSTLHTDLSCILLNWKLWRLQYSGSTFILKYINKNTKKFFVVLETAVKCFSRIVLYKTYPLDFTSCNLVLILAMQKKIHNDRKNVG